jgi:ApbE superfamily uncharacterized protein (UPF0280 family)
MAVISICSEALTASLPFSPEQSPLSSRVGLRLAADEMPVGVCTSSGTVGHSLSLGSADSVTVLADSAVVADAAATRIGNDVGNYKNPRDGVQRALDTAAELAGIQGVLVICAELLRGLRQGGACST